MTLTSLYFSPTGATRKLVNAFAQGFGEAHTENDMTLPAQRQTPPVDGGEGLFVFAGPVYGGRSFKLLTNAIRSLQGGGRPAVCIASYGGRHYDMALADLFEAADTAGFCVIACGAFVAEHSYSKKIQSGRPDAKDLALAQSFGQQSRQLLKSFAAHGENPKGFCKETVPQRAIDLDAIGMHRERLGRMTPNRPAPNESCLHCGVCATVCPLGLIDPADSAAIEERCIKCNACVKACPVGAMRFSQEDFLTVVQDCEKSFGKRKCAPQLWLAAQEACSD